MVVKTHTHTHTHTHTYTSWQLWNSTDYTSISPTSVTNGIPWLGLLCPSSGKWHLSLVLTRSVDPEVSFSFSAPSDHSRLLIVLPSPNLLCSLHNKSMNLRPGQVLLWGRDFIWEPADWEDGRLAPQKPSCWGLDVRFFYGSEMGEKVRNKVKGKITDYKEFVILSNIS